MKLSSTLILATLCFCSKLNAQEAPLTAKDFKEIIPILKGDTLLFCDQVETYNIGFFPTQELILEFKQLGASKEMIDCLKENFTKDLIFHVVHFQCLTDDCSVHTKDVTVETIESVFHSKKSRKTLKFYQKQIVDYPIENSKFTNDQLPTVYLTGIIHEDEVGSGFTVDVSFKYQNVYNKGGQLISSQDFYFKSMDRKDVENSSDRIASWALKLIEKEVNSR